MNNPYSVLGVSPNASDSEIKKAYRDLARKYHPDNYHDNPLADLAQEKMKEINEAYDLITRERASGNSGSGYRTAGGWSGGYRANSSGTSSEFAEIRAAINANQLDRAMQLLDASNNRNAEWNFLMGSVYYRRGWLDEARNFYERAVSMDPSNAEYRQALNYMNVGSPTYRQSSYVQNSGTDCCDVCAAMACMNMLCRCM